MLDNRLNIAGSDTLTSRYNQLFMSTRHFDSDNPPDGLGANSNVHICSINLSVNTFYAPKNDYEVILEGVEIDGETFNTVIASFSIEKRHAIPDFIRD